MVILVVIDVVMRGFVVVNICPVVLFGFVVTLSVTYLVIVRIMARLAMIRSPVPFAVLILSLFLRKLSM